MKDSFHGDWWSEPLVYLFYEVLYDALAFLSYIFSAINMRQNLDDQTIFVIRNIDNYQSTIIRLDEWSLWRTQHKTIHFIRFPVFWECITSKKGYLSIDQNLKLIFICENSNKDANNLFSSLEMKHHVMSRELLRVSIKRLTAKALSCSIKRLLNNYSIATSPDIPKILREKIKTNLADKHDFIMLKISNLFSPDFQD